MDVSLGYENTPATPPPAAAPAPAPPSGPPAIWLCLGIPARRRGRPPGAVSGPSAAAAAPSGAKLKLWLPPQLAGISPAGPGPLEVMLDVRLRLERGFLAAATGSYENDACDGVGPSAVRLIFTLVPFCAVELVGFGSSWQEGH